MSADHLDPMDMNAFLGATFRISDLSAKPPQATYTLNADMVKLLVSLDGKTPMKNIARNLNVPADQLHNSTEKLFNQGLLEKARSSANVLDAPFYELLSAAVARIVGPIAPILIDDAIAGLGYQRSSFPVERVAELINSLSMEIKEKDKRLAFQQYMIKLLKEKKYLRL